MTDSAAIYKECLGPNWPKYDAAQERGEVEKPGGDRRSINISDENNERAKVADLGLTPKQVHDARQIRDAEKAEPGMPSLFYALSCALTIFLPLLPTFF